MKSKESFLEKIQRKSYTDYSTEVEDLVGARIVCLFSSDLAELRGLVSDAFEILSEENKIDDAPEDTFGYMSVHYVCKLKTNAGGHRYAGLSDIKFEIQCRTLLMDAWANVSHHLAYKGEASIPKQLRRQFNALAGLFYVADSSFEELDRQSKMSDLHASTRIAAEPQAAATHQIDAPIDRSTLTAFLHSLPRDMTDSDPNSISEFVQELAAVKLTSLNELSRTVSENWNAALSYEKSHPPFDPKSIEPTIFNALGLSRVAVAIANEEYAQRFSKHGDYKPFRSTDRED